MQTEHRFYRLVRPGGSGSFICPPGHLRHDYELHEYSSPRGRRVQGVFAVDYALEPIAAAYPYLVHQVQKIMDGAELVESEAWIRMVYGYFRSMYAPLGGSRNVAYAVHDPDGVMPPEAHLAVLMVQDYFPHHEPRLDLIADPGKGYGSWPCDRCGNRVQYEPKFDKLAMVSTRMVGGETKWTYGVECNGTDHVVSEDEG